MNLCPYVQHLNCLVPNITAASSFSVTDKFCSATFLSICKDNSLLHACGASIHVPQACYVMQVLCQNWRCISVSKKLFHGPMTTHTSYTSWSARLVAAQCQHILEFILVITTDAKKWSQVLDCSCSWEIFNELGLVGWGIWSKFQYVVQIFYLPLSKMTLA